MASYKIKIESGIGVGKTFIINPPGAGIGRSDKNDIAIADELLSRHHCKIYFKGEEPWISDLATLNGTAINGEIIKADVLLKPGDSITVGDTTLRFTSKDGGSAVPHSEDSAGIDGTSEPAVIDLGFESDTTTNDVKHALKTKKTVMRMSIAFAAICIVAIGIKVLLPDKEKESLVRLVTELTERTLEIRYVKTEATAENVFKYELILDHEGFVTVAIDDLAQSRHVRKTTDTAIPQEVRLSLIRKIEDSGFFEMPHSSEGVAQANTWNSATLMVIIDGNVKQARVRNRIGSAAFKQLREEIEAFSRTELGLWAVEFSSDKLLELAYEELILARKFSDERDVSPNNLFAAMQAYKSCAAYLETIEPKPDFFNDAVSELAKAENDLQQTYLDRSWQADHAINTREWEKAAFILRELLEIIPDRGDERNKDVARRLLDVEARLRQNRR